MRSFYATTVAVVCSFLLSDRKSLAFIAGCSACRSRDITSIQERVRGITSSTDRTRNPPALPSTSRGSEQISGDEELQLREGLPDYPGEWQLREALAECELAILAGVSPPPEVRDGLAGVSPPPEGRDGEAAVIKRAATRIAAMGVVVEDAVATATPDAASAPLLGLRHFARAGIDGVFMGSAGVPVRYRLFPMYSPQEEGGALKPGVVLLTGLMETMVKYGETIADINERGFSVYTFDHHGQGLSGRLPVPDGADPTVAHITDFQRYVDDLLHFSKVVLPATVPRHREASPGARVEQSGRDNPSSGVVWDEPSVAGGARLMSGENTREGPLWRKDRACDMGAGGGIPAESSCGFEALELSVVAHSMGGLMAVYAALEEPLLFNGVVLAAPMMAPNTGRLPNAVVGAVAWVATKLGQGHRSPIRRPAQPSMKGSKVTHDEGRLQLWECLRSEVGCVLHRGPSFAWLSQAVRASKRARRRAAQLSTPVLVLEAGLDTLVRSDGIQRFLWEVPSAEYRLFAGAYHDLFDETDSIRSKVLEETYSFLSALEAPRPRP